MNNSTSTMIQAGLKHYVMADIILAPILGLIIEGFIVFQLKSDAYLFTQGIGGIILESFITVLSVWLSSLTFKRYKSKDGWIALTSLGFIFIVFILSLPYAAFFAHLGKTSTNFFLTKDIFHIIVFYVVTAICYKEYSVFIFPIKKVE